MSKKFASVAVFAACLMPTPVLYAGAAAPVRVESVAYQEPLVAFLSSVPPQLTVAVVNFLNTPSVSEEADKLELNKMLIGVQNLPREEADGKIKDLVRRLPDIDRHPEKLGGIAKKLLTLDQALTSRGTGPSVLYPEQQRSLDLARKRMVVRFAELRKMMSSADIGVAVFPGGPSQAAARAHLQPAAPGDAAAIKSVPTGETKLLRATDGNWSEEAAPLLGKLDSMSRLKWELLARENPPPGLFQDLNGATIAGMYHEKSQGWHVVVIFAGTVRSVSREPRPGQEPFYTARIVGSNGKVQTVPLTGLGRLYRLKTPI